MTQTEAKWAARVREWRASGETAEQFTEGQGFKASTLRFWASRLRGKAATVGTPPTAPGEAGGVQVVRVRRTRARTPGVGSATSGGSTPEATMVIVIGTARIEVRSGFDRALFSDVIEALGGAR
jgi:hypothetical protein